MYQTSSYDTGHSEQAFLNWYYSGRFTELHTKYNANMAIWKHDQKYWYSEVYPPKIYHHTITKPGAENDKFYNELIYAPFYDMQEALHRLHGQCPYSILPPKKNT